MKFLLLERKPSGVKETQGFLSFDNTVIHTIEQEWRRDPTRRGGESNNSCVPNGEYQLIPHRRPNGDNVYALVNETQKVFYSPNDVPANGGRFLILIHPGNWSTDVTGCIAPGLGKVSSLKGPMVTKSRSAMERIKNYIGENDAILQIAWI